MISSGQLARPEVGSYLAVLSEIAPGCFKVEIGIAGRKDTTILVRNEVERWIRLREARLQEVSA